MSARELVVGIALIVFGALISDPIKEEADRLYHRACGTPEYLKNGDQLRKQAIARARESRNWYGPSAQRRSVEIDALHGQANALYEKALACGSQVAKAQLGTAHCIGFSVAQDRPKGLIMIRDAATREPAVIEWVANIDVYCPKVGNGVKVSD